MYSTNTYRIKVHYCLLAEFALSLSLGLCSEIEKPQQESVTHSALVFFAQVPLKRFEMVVRKVQHSSKAKELSYD